MTEKNMPSDSQIAKLLSLPLEEPVAVLNLFQFNDQAQYLPEDPEFNTDAANITGEEALAVYSVSAGKYLRDLGGRLVFSTQVDQVMIGSENIQWDRAAIMYFPTRKAFMEMLRDPTFKKISRHRKAALANHYMLHLSGNSFME